MGYTLKQVTGGDHTLNPPTTTVKYLGHGTPEPLPGGDVWDFVAAHAIAFIPLTYVHPSGAILVRKDVKVHENWYAKMYEITVPYGLKDETKDPEETGAYTITIDGLGGTQHVTAGVRVAGFGDAADAVDNKGLIGVDGDEVHGVDIPVSESKVAVRFRHPGGVLNGAYIKKVQKLVGHPNNDPFLLWDAGEVKLIAPHFSESETEATASYDFAISLNATNIQIGEITGISKKGWEVFSISYKDDVVAGQPIKKVAYVEVIKWPGGKMDKDYVSTLGWGGA